MSLLSRLANWLDPAACLICGQSQSWLCPFCFSKIKQKAPRCFTCGCLNQSGLCLDCSPGWQLDGIIAAGSYSDRRLRQLIKAYKYRFSKQLSGPLSSLLIKAYRKQAPLANICPTAIAAIPLHCSRERWRGFNQSLLLANKIAKTEDWPLLNGLKRKKAGNSQAGLSITKRKQNLIGAFSYEGPKLDGEEILIIDDVITSGQTLNQAAKVLKKAGAESVWALVLAKK